MGNYVKNNGGKGLLALLVLVVSLTVLAGCAGEKKLYSIEVFTMLANYSGIQSGWFGKIVKDKFNIEMNIIPVAPDKSTYATRAASGNLGDLIVFGDNTTDYTDAIEARLLRPWNDLLDKYGPDIKKNMANALEHNKNTFGGGKNIYGFGHNVALSPREYQSGMYHPDLRYDLFKALPDNLKQLKTLEDYIPALKEMQKMERAATGQKDIYAISLFPNWDGDAVMFVKALGALYGYDEFGFSHYDAGTKTVKPYIEEGSMYLRALKFFNTAFREGILDPNSPTTGSGDVVWEKLKNGKILFALFKFMADNYNSEANLAAGKAMYAVPAADLKPIVYGCSIYGGERVWAIGSKAEHPERVMELINWLSTPEGVMVVNHGPQQLTWDYDKNNKPYYTEYGLKAAIGDKNTIVPDEWGGGKFADGDSKINNTTFALDVINPVSGEKFNRDFWTSELTRTAPRALAEWRADASALAGKVILTPDEFLNDRYTIATGSTFTKASRNAELELKYKAVSQAIKTNTWLALMAPTEAEYNKRVATLMADAKKAGLDECVAWDKAQGEIRRQKELEAEAAIKK